MYNFMSLCYIQFFTSSLKPMHGFASNFVWILLGGPLPSLSMEFWVILCNFWSILKKNVFYKTTDQKSSIFGLESSKKTLFLVYSN